MANTDKYNQYVDEYRKINTIQKLPPIQVNFSAFYGEDKDKNKFMRFRQQPYYQIKQKQDDQQQHVFKNQYIQDIVKNQLQPTKQQYLQKDHNLKQNTQHYKIHSRQNIDSTRNNTYNFYYGKATCPTSISEQSLGKKAINIKNVIMNMEDYYQNDQNHQGPNIKQPKINKILKHQYDFHQINQQRKRDLQQNHQKQIMQLDMDQQQLQIDRELRKYSKYTTLQQIDAIDQAQINHRQFCYDLNQEDTQQDKQLEKYMIDKLTYNSVHRNQFIPELQVQYYRQIGLPLWNIDKYSKLNHKYQSKDQKDHQIIKQKANYLHLLKQSQLNINKKNMNFNDISNIANGRITSSNAYLCIRSQKVTRAQYEKLLRKLNKYKQQQLEKGKKRKQIGVITQDIDIMQDSDKGKTPKYTMQQTSDTTFIVNQISKLREQSQKMRISQKKGEIIYNNKKFETQNYNRMKNLLKKLYNIICIDPKTYVFDSIASFLDQPKKILHEEFSDGKLLWYIVETMDEANSYIEQEDNLQKLLNKKSLEVPILKQYKNTKLIQQRNMGVKKLYTYRQKNSIIQSKNKPILDKMKPHDSYQQTLRKKSVTPTKQSNIATKKKSDKSPLKPQYLGSTKSKKLIY